MNRTQYANIYKRLAKTKTRYVECLKITRLDGTIYRFTGHDTDMRITEADGQPYDYKSANSFQLTAIESQMGLVVSNMDINAIIDDDDISGDDLLAGLFDHANFELFIAYWTNSNVGILPLRTTWVGELRVEGADFKADLRGIAQRLAQTFVETTSLECRYQFCDAGCGLNEADFTENVVVATVASQDTFTAGIAQGNYGKYVWGLAKFTSGGNVGVEMEIIRNFNNKLQLFLPVPYAINQGDTLTLIEGCDKTYSTCGVFGNIRYFGGEPFLTGSDHLTSYPSSAQPEQEADPSILDAL
jgi:uncharacterized phage protein (TIGR02218 family)